VVRLDRQGAPPLVRRSRRDGSYLSSSDPRVHFGLGAATRYEGIIVTWPDGHRQRLPGGETNRVLQIKKGRP
ncbi:MAG TPA: ASPIC/UnbV domain-containing protein, partial [Bryobacteraceae bacterium]|nr:ASPIC/UnbV domain-containing protein [Bryobacteraceae bacterium]